MPKNVVRCFNFSTLLKYKHSKNTLKEVKKSQNSKIQNFRKKKEFVIVFFHDLNLFYSPLFE